MVPTPTVFGRGGQIPLRERSITTYVETPMASLDRQIEPVDRGNPFSLSQINDL